MLLNTDMLAQAQRAGQALASVDTEKLLSRLCVDVESFSMGEITPDFAPLLPAVNQVIVLYVIKGEGSLEWSGGAISLAEGMVVAIPNNLQTILRGFARREAADDSAGLAGAENHGASLEEAGNLIVASSVVTASAGHGLGYFESLKQPLVDDSEDGLLTLIFSSVLNELKTPGIGSKCIVEALIKQVLIVMLRRTLAGQNVTTPLYLTVANPSLALVINTIQDSHATRLSIPGLAQLVGMTSFGLTREFERVFGESLLDYIQGVRLYQATTMLTQTDLPIKFIAASVGFASRSHFSRAFRKRQGEDPTSFRKKFAAGAMEFFQPRDEDQLVLSEFRS